MQRSRSKEPGPIVSCQTPTCTGKSEVKPIFFRASSNLENQYMHFSTSIRAAPNTNKIKYQINMKNIIKKLNFQVNPPKIISMEIYIVNITQSEKGSLPLSNKNMLNQKECNASNTD